MVGRRGEALGTYPAVVFLGLDQSSRHATPPAAASGSLSPSVYPPWDGNQLETRTYVGCREEGVGGESPAPGRLTVVRSPGTGRGGNHPTTGVPSGEFQRVEAPPDVVEDFSDDGWMGDQPGDTHPLAATTEKRIDLVDAADEARPRFPAGRKPGTVGSRRIGRLVLRRDLDEGLAPKCDSAVGVRVPSVV